LIFKSCRQHNVSTTSPAGCTALSTYSTWPSGVLLLDQPPEIRFQASSEMRLRIFSGSSWEDCFSHNISVLSALEVYTTVRYINRRFTYLRTYLLTMLLNRNI